MRWNDEWQNITLTKKSARSLNMLSNQDGLSCREQVTPIAHCVALREIEVVARYVSSARHRIPENMLDGCYNKSIDASINSERKNDYDLAIYVTFERSRRIHRRAR